MTHSLDTDKKDITAILAAAAQLSNEYLTAINEQAVGHTHPQTILPPLPDAGYGALDVIEMFKKDFLPNIVASSGPRYWGFVTGGTTPAAIAGDWLTTVFDQNTQSAKGNGDISSILEQHTIKLLLALFNLPDDFMGGFVTGATMSNFTGLAVARQWWGQQHGWDIARQGMQAGIKIYTAVPHSSAIKSLAMLGIGSNNIITIPSLPDREAIDTKAFTDQLKNQGNEPFILLASGGTVNTVDFDDMRFIASLRDTFNFWWHIDAAFGGFAACSSQYSYLLDGWQEADSITIDNHKWLNVPYDSAIILTRKEHAQLQVQTFQNSNAPYLGDPLQNFTYLNYLPENSRRFRALPAWFSLMAYGKQGYAGIVENNIALAQQLGKALESSAHYMVIAPVRLNTVCFTLKEEADRTEKIPVLLQELNRRGKVFVTPSVYKGTPCIRAAFVNWSTTEDDIALAIQELNEVYQKINK